MRPIMSMLVREYCFGPEWVWNWMGQDTMGRDTITSTVSNDEESGNVSESTNLK